MEAPVFQAVLKGDLPVRCVVLASHEFFVSSVAHFLCVFDVFWRVKQVKQGFFVDLSLSFRDLEKVGLTNFHVF